MLADDSRCGRLPADGAVGLAAFAPAASAAPPNPAVQLTALCRAHRAGNCSAIGSYDDGLGDTQGLLPRETHGRGSRPSRRSSGRRRHRSVQGQQRRRAGRCLLPRSWRLRRRRALHGQPTASTTACCSPNPRTLAARRPGAASRPTPSRPTSPGRASPTISGFGGRRCSSVGNCVAVGNYETNAEVWEALIVDRAQRPLGARGRGAASSRDARWRARTRSCCAVTCSPPAPAPRPASYVDAAGHQQALLVSGSGGIWTAAPAPGAAGDADVDPNIIPSSISCADAGDCAAVGTYVNPLQNSLGLLLSESGGTWAGGTGAALPDERRACQHGRRPDRRARLRRMPAGWRLHSRRLVLRQRRERPGAACQPSTAAPGSRASRCTLPANAVQGLEKQSAGLDWISCPSAGNCLATGVYTDAGYNSQGLLLSEVDGVWQPAARVAAAAQRRQHPVRGRQPVRLHRCRRLCRDRPVQRQTRRRLGYTLSETSGTWGQSTELALPAATQPRSSSHSARSWPQRARPPSSREIRQAHHFVYDYQAVEPGTATASWYASEGGQRILIGSRPAARDRRRPRQAEAGPDQRRPRLLARATHLSVTATARFAPHGHSARRRRASRFALR